MDPRVEAVLDILDSRWKDRIEVEHVARSVNLSPVRLQHLFKQETGTTVTGYVREKRLTYAAELLRHTKLSVKEVCHQTGFTDPRDFNRSFKREFGACPSVFRSSANPEQ